jgi:hypothetical protein
LRCSILKVIFACVHNAGRSQMSAAFFNKYIDPAKAKAISAGAHPGDRVHPQVIEAMREVGIDLSAAQPQKLTPELAQGAKRAGQFGFLHDGRSHEYGFGRTRRDFMDQSCNPNTAQIEITPNPNSCFLTCRFAKQSLNAAIGESP